MKQWIIDICNEGQKEWMFFNDIKPTLTEALTCDDIGVSYKDYRKKGKDIIKISIYEFLYNPKWGFAKAFWGEGVEKIPDGIRIQPHTYGNGFDTYEKIKTVISNEYHLQQMVISKDPLKYLEQFKELSNRVGLNK